MLLWELAYSSSNRMSASYALQARESSMFLSLILYLQMHTSKAITILCIYHSLLLAVPAVAAKAEVLTKAEEGTCTCFALAGPSALLLLAVGLCIAILARLGTVAKPPQAPAGPLCCGILDSCELGCGRLSPAVPVPARASASVRAARDCCQPSVALWATRSPD